MVYFKGLVSFLFLALFIGSPPGVLGRLLENIDVYEIDNDLERNILGPTLDYSPSVYLDGRRTKTQPGAEGRCSPVGPLQIKPDKANFDVVPVPSETINLSDSGRNQNNLLGEEGKNRKSTMGYPYESGPIQSRYEYDDKLADDVDLGRQGPRRLTDFIEFSRPPPQIVPSRKSNMGYPEQPPMQQPYPYPQDPMQSQYGDPMQQQPNQYGNPMQPPQMPYNAQMQPPQMPYPPPYTPPYTTPHAPPVQPQKQPQTAPKLPPKKRTMGDAVMDRMMDVPMILVDKGAPLFGKFLSVLNKAGGGRKSGISIETNPQRNKMLLAAFREFLKTEMKNADVNLDGIDMNNLDPNSKIVCQTVRQ